MKLFSFFGGNKKRTVVIVQCRLSSTRLPRKALLPLGGKTVLEWTLTAMKNVKADAYYLATDTDSEADLVPIAKKCKWELYAGSKNDVLERFCRVIEKSKAQYVLRATADNPFLFYEAAQELLDDFAARTQTSGIDYMTYSGLPHGSGVEVFKADSLLRAAKLTESDYDHEHVGPALYNHTDRFKSLFLPAPEKYCYPQMRTTIDTLFDYNRSLTVVKDVSGDSAVKKSYTCQTIIEAMSKDSIKYPVLYVPSVQKGHGTGHLHRCLSLALETGGDIYIPEDASLEQCTALVNEALENGLEPWHVTSTLNYVSQYKLCVVDMFQSSSSLLKKLSESCCVVALDEGGNATDCVDYLLDIIPAVGISREANLVEPAFIPLPERRHGVESLEAKIHTALVVLGGEDPSGLSVPTANALADNSIYVTLVCPSALSVQEVQGRISEKNAQYIKVVPPVQNLKEKLYEYDLVVTHYGFTAFEASAAGCAVILLGTTVLHIELAREYGFSYLEANQISAGSFKTLIENPSALRNQKSFGESKSLAEYISILSRGMKLSCPVCRTDFQEQDTLISRIPERTFRRCRNCGMLYQSWTVQSKQTEYNYDYFFADYQKQYGKTYLDDFSTIKAQGVRRTGIIDMLYRRKHSSVTPTILDIGCAMGPFLDAANDAGWQVFGTDVAEDAVDYVQNKLHFPAIKASFPEIDVTKEFGVEAFDAVTMWFVIEHFQDLDKVLRAVSGIVRKGGIFAFSTPSAAGVSAKYNTNTFFRESPADHYSLWEPKRADSILRRYGFKVCRIVPTGIHPERFPCAKKKNLQPSSLKFKALGTISRLCKLGDTFEVYCRKEK